MLFLGEMLPPGNNDYAPMDLRWDHWVRGSHTNFTLEYQRGVDANASWVQNPLAVAMQVAGYPNEDNINPERVTLSFPKPGKIDAVILSREAGDDAIRRTETRVEMIQKENFWMVEWAGVRSKCRRTLYPGWGPGGCP